MTSRSLSASKYFGVAFSFFIAAMTSPLALSEEALPQNAEAEIETIQVLGGSRFDLVQPTSPTRVSQKKLESLKTTNVGEALKSAPGVYVREEDGEGLRPNIGLRGTNPDRSKKIVILQDGILIGPAPYAAPAAYYVPSMINTESLEVLSGFSAVHYGPNSIGGAVNYLTHDFSPKSSLDFGYGSFETSRLIATTGGVGENFSHSIRVSRVSSGGFKQLDGGGPTGFSQDSVLAKFKVGSNFKTTLGWSREDSQETYLGLSQADFSQNAYRRYSASAADQMKWQHLLAQVEYESSVGSDDTLKVTAYHHQFSRRWYRIDRFRDSTVNLRDILRDPTAAGNQLFYDILRGASDTSSVGSGGELVIASNDRDYVSEGLQARWVGEGITGDLKHSYQGIFRLHHDRIERNHTFDFYEMNGGRLQKTATGTQRDRLNRDEALAALISAQDDVTIGDYTLTGVARFEVVSFEFEDRLTGISRFRSDSVFVPGLSLLKKLGDNFSARGSVNLAATVAGLDSTGREKREEAMNYEIGLKYFAGERDLQADVTFFLNDYENLTGTCTASTGCAAASLDSQVNGGRARVLGAEARFADGFQVGPVWIPAILNATLISASLQSYYNSTNAEWGVGPIATGDPLPYVPELQYSASVGAEWSKGRHKFSNEVSLNFQSRTFDQSSVTNRTEIPAFGVANWSGRYEWDSGRYLQLKVDNILGREYAVAARPFGLRPGKPRTFLATLGFSF